jgi:hypothetical protein
MKRDTTSQLSCCCDVQLATADDTDIRQVVAYYLNSFHTYEEIKEMERLQFPTTFKKRWASQRFEIDQITEMWDPSGGGVNPDFFCNKKVWRSWVQVVCDVTVHWDGFDHWNWGHFLDVQNMGINKLLGSDFHRFTVYLLAFFIHSFVRRLATIRLPYFVLPPSPVILVPSTEGSSAMGTTIFPSLLCRHLWPTNVYCFQNN